MTRASGNKDTNKMFCVFATIFIISKNKQNLVFQNFVVTISQLVFPALDRFHFSCPSDLHLRFNTKSPSPELLDFHFTVSEKQMQHQHPSQQFLRSCLISQRLYYPGVFLCIVIPCFKEHFSRIALLAGQAAQ